MEELHGKGVEVFITQVPDHLTDQSLKRSLNPFIAKLGLTDWTCQKFRGQRSGLITFLHLSHGEKFLSVHGELAIPGFNPMGQQRKRPRLHFLGAGIFCRKSRSSPDPFLLRSLMNAAEEREKKDQSQPPPASDKTVSFQLDGLSCGHYEYPDGQFAYTADIEWPAQGTAKFGRDTLIINYTCLQIPLRVEIPYRAIYQVFVSARPTSLVLTLWESPRFFLTTGQDLISLMSQLGVSGTSSGMNNVTKFRLSHLSKTDKTDNSTSHDEILGQSLVYRLKISPQDFESRLQRLREKENLKFSYYEFPSTLTGRTYMADELKVFHRLITQCYGIVPFDVLFQLHGLVHNGFLLPQTVGALIDRLRKTASMPFTDGYLRSTTNGTNGTKNGGHGIYGVMNASSIPFSAGAIKKLFSQISFPAPDVEATMFSLDEIWSCLETNEKEIRYGTTKDLMSERVHQNLIMVYKVQVTPTKFTLLGPEPEAKNRVLKKFPNHTGHFLRVQFCEEDGQDLFFNAKVSLNQIWSRFKNFLLNGVLIAGRRYEFLGFSHSSLRAHSAWFMAPFVDDNGKAQNYSSVIQDLGKFDEIHCPPRCAARIGQAFSETPFSIDLQKLGVQVQYIPDVKSSDGSRVFSDGVGTLSRSLLKDIHAALPLNRDTTTCFQIRWGGAKGMLSLDSTIKGTVMRIRPESMIKFVSEDLRYLEICDMGNKPIPLVLNRQLIKILEDMGVKEKWFMKIQSHELERLRMITAHVHNTIIFLRKQKVAEQVNFSKFIRRLHKLDIDYRKDSFLCSVVENVVLREVRLLKHKARIPVEKGVTLFGVVDEYGFLEEDEIYFTFEKKKFAGSRQSPRLNQPVLISRSPALHPGDIQMKFSRTPPPNHPLRALSNCVVFSQKGERDLPSQLSGGDLDGDIYNIIWDDEAVKSAMRQFNPADYPRVPPLNIGRAVTREDMTNFFVEFMATDQLGVIAVKHMILADMKDFGTQDPECLQLAEMHSTGVDYSKSGIPIDTDKLRKLTRTRYRPDFMAPAPPAKIIDRTEIVFEAPTAPSLEDDDDDAGPNYQYYKSIKVLGKLYRAIDEKKIWIEDIHQTVRQRGSSVWDELLMHIKGQCRKLGRVNWQASQAEASRIRQAYDDAIWSASMDHSDNATKNLTEVEVFTGCIFNKSGVQTKRQRDRSVRLKDDFDRIAKWTESLIRKKNIELREDDFDEDNDNNDPYVDTYIGGSPASGSVSKNDGPSLDASALELSIACLHVGAAKSTNFGRNEGDFQSFKVIAAQCALTELEIALTGW